MGGQSRSRLWVEETAFSEAESKDRRGTRSREQERMGGMAGMPNRRALRHVCQEQIGRRRGRVRVECLNAALKGGS